MAKPPFKLAGEYCDLEAPTSGFVLRDLIFSLNKNPDFGNRAHYAVFLLGAFNRQGFSTFLSLLSNNPKSNMISQ